MQRTISAMVGKGSVNHNSRKFKAENVDGSRNNPLLSIYRKNAVNIATTNICSFFLDKALSIGNYVALVFPKFLLNTPEFAQTRKYLSDKAVDCIIDFGERGFPGVLIETLAIFINNLSRPSNTRVVSITNGKFMIQSQNYIFDSKLPYWILYRNDNFDSVCKKLDFNVFKVFRDRQQFLKIYDDINLFRNYMYIFKNIMKIS